MNSAYLLSKQTTDELIRETIFRTEADIILDNSL